MGLYNYVLLILILLSFSLNCVWGEKKITEIIDSLFPEKGDKSSDFYDKRIRPNYGGPPVKVTLSAYMLDVYDVDEKRHEFTTQFYFRQKWNDPRCVFQPPAGVNQITLDPEHAQKLWIPDTFSVNERSSNQHDFTMKNEFTKISPSGEVFRSVRATVTANCKMNLKWFPFDRHVCSLEFESFAYTANEFIYEWMTDSQGQPKIGVSEGAGGSINQEVKAIKGVSLFVNLTSGSYARVAIEMLIVRVPTRFLQDVYFPAFVLTTIAFITMSVGALQFRMVGIVIFQSLLSGEMPKVSYQTALDFYVFKCSFMVFNVVIVNFIMYHLLKPTSRSHMRMRMRQMKGGPEDAKEILPETEPSEDFNMGRPAFDSKFKELVYKCCMYSTYTMPCFFILFNIIYWMVVLIGSGSAGSDVDFMILENTS